MLPQAMDCRIQQVWGFRKNRTLLTTCFQSPSLLSKVTQMSAALRDSSHKAPLAPNQVSPRHPESLEGFIPQESLPVQRDHLRSLYLWPLLGCGWEDVQDGSSAEHKPSRGGPPACICWVKSSKKNLLGSLCVTRSAAVRRLPWCFPWKSSKCFYSNQDTQSVSPGKSHSTPVDFPSKLVLTGYGWLLGTGTRNGFPQSESKPWNSKKIK